ncbi:MAG: hypothetical protein WD767_07740, partial [Alphaproteobacteria bacterium]
YSKGKPRRKSDGVCQRSDVGWNPTRFCALILLVPEGQWTFEKHFPAKFWRESSLKRSSTMASDSETLKKDIAELRASIETLTRDVTSMSQSMSDGLKERASRTADSVRNGARNAANEIGVKGRQSAEAVENTVRDKPLQSLVVAFGAGLLLAQLLRKR